MESQDLEPIVEAKTKLEKYVHPDGVEFRLYEKGHEMISALLELGWKLTKK